MKRRGYTALYALTLSGKLLSKVSICLQEVSGRFGPQVSQEVARPMEEFRNVVFTCTKSGQINPALYEELKDENEQLTCTFKVIPPKCIPLCQSYVYFYRQVKHLIPRIQNHYASEKDSLKGCHQNSVRGASPPVGGSLCGNDKIRLICNEAVATEENVLPCEYEENTLHMRRGRVYTLFMVQGISILWMLPYILSSSGLRLNRIRTSSSSSRSSSLMRSNALLICTKYDIIFVLSFWILH